MQSGMHSCQCQPIDISSKICPCITNQHVHYDFLLIYCKYCLISQPKTKHAFNKNTVVSAISSWKRWYIVERCVLLHMIWFQSLEPIILNLAKQPLQNWKHASHDRCKNPKAHLMTAAKFKKHISWPLQNFLWQIHNVLCTINKFAANHHNFSTTLPPAYRWLVLSAIA